MRFIYKDDQVALKGHTLVPGKVNAQRLVDNNREIVFRRWAASNKVVPPNHLLVKLLGGLAVSREITDAMLQYEVSRAVPRLALSLRLASATSYGKSRQSVFFRGLEECIHLSYDSFDKSGDWLDLSPITILYHPHTNLNFNMGVPGEEGVAIIDINLYMLAYQWLQFKRMAGKDNFNGNSYRFLSSIPMMNAMPRYFDISWFNRLYKTVVGKPIPDDDKNDYIAFPDHDSKLFNVGIEMLDKIETRRLNVGQYLYQTKCWSMDNAHELTKVPTRLITANNEWLFDVMQFPFIHYGLLLSELTESASNRGSLSLLKREIRAMRTSRVLEKQHDAVKVHIIGNLIEPIEAMTI